MDGQFNFVITDYEFPSIAIERGVIETAGGKLSALQSRSEAEIITAARDAVALLVQYAPITRTVIEGLKSCKVIVRYGIGTDNIDLAAARENGIVVSNVPNYCIDEVADHTFAMAMCLARQISAIDALVREGVWKITPPQPMRALRQMKFVTIGFGRIGRAVLDRAKACRFQLATCDPFLESDKLSGDIPNLDLDTALETADILSLHVPLTQENRHMINAKTLSTMKSSAILVNTARGGLIDTVALAAALNSGKIAGAGIDVFESEHLQANHPLLSCPNTLLNPHIAWYSELSSQELQRLAAEEAVRVVFGEAPQSRVA